jgi:hypothetical protein
VNINVAYSLSTERRKKKMSVEEDEMFIVLLYSTELIFDNV